MTSSADIILDLTQSISASSEMDEIFRRIFVIFLLPGRVISVVKRIRLWSDGENESTSKSIAQESRVIVRSNVCPFVWVAD